MEPVFVMTSSINRRNHAKCEVYEDRVVLSTACDGGLMPVYENKSRTICFSELREVIVSKGGVKLITHHPNALHFVTKDSTRTVDSMYRDRGFHASDYLREGVFQLAPKSEAELEEKIQTAREIQRFVMERIRPEGEP